VTKRWSNPNWGGKGPGWGNTLVCLALAFGAMAALVAIAAFLGGER